ncbi:MAG: DNA polymerase III subunit epsilon [Leptothrix ochracea]|uniref:DNA polymerase III subunit epsilon n=1 Tax=Leptothrix ochracea TaxID=735331 RepID=UPI0034E29912
MRQVFLDTETTGLHPDRGDRVIEIGCIEMDNRQLTGRTFHHYLNPERASHEDAVKIHGLTDEFLADKPLFAAVVDELLDFVAGAEIIIHNAAFDLGFLNAELKRLGKPTFASHTGPVVDSLLMARDQFPGKANSLDALCKRLDVDSTGRTLHGALLDAGLLAEVYLRMTRGQKTFAMDDDDAHGGHAGGAGALADFSALTLIIQPPTEAERVAHRAMVEELDKFSKGKALWQKIAL